jgi:hypothetical protein
MEAGDGPIGDLRFGDVQREIAAPWKFASSMSWAVRRWRGWRNRAGTLRWMRPRWT